MHHNCDNANQKQLSCKPNDQQNSNKLKIWRASLILKQSEGFLSQKKHWCAPWYSTMQKKNKHAVATPENSKAAFINTQSTYLVKANNHDNWQANRQKSWRTILFCFSPKNSLLGLGNWWSWQFPLQSATHQSNLNTNLHPNGFFVLPRDADVATAGISAANCEKKYIRVRRRWGTSICMWLACSYAHLNNSNVFVHNFF